MRALTDKEIDEFVARRTLPIMDQVDERMFSNAISIIGELVLRGAPEMKVIISSTGGDVDRGLNIHDLIASYPGKTVGIVTDVAASMACTILQACDDRLVMQHSRLLIHHVSRRSVSFDVIMNDEKLAQLKADLVKTQERLWKILETRTKKSRDEVRRACEKDEAMPVEDALTFGLTDRILTRADMAQFYNPEFLKLLQKQKSAE